MGLLGTFFKPKKPILTEEDTKELREIQRKAYMEEAKKLVEEGAKIRARKELGVIQKKEKDGF